MSWSEIQNSSECFEKSYKWSKPFLQNNLANSTKYRPFYLGQIQIEAGDCLD